ncbi:hypothetical protein ACFPM0_23840 [Pseudonocardia sulfidoxydans]
MSSSSRSRSSPPTSPATWGWTWRPGRRSRPPWRRPAVRAARSG